MILYVTKHFLNKVKWFKENFPSLEFVCYVEILQASLLNLPKIGWALQVTSKMWMSTNSSNFPGFKMQLKIFYIKQTYIFFISLQFSAEVVEIGRYSATPRNL